MYEVARSHIIREPGDKGLDALRIDLESYIYLYLAEHYGTMLQTHWETYLPPWESEHAFVLVERRAHPHFRFILQNIAWACPTMAVYIFCSDENRAFIETLLGDKVGHFHIIQAFQGPASREEGKQAYNNVLTDYRFYQCIQATYIMTVQMDTIFRKKLDTALFTGDYWGNPWRWQSAHAGGGGATIRRVVFMIELCQTHRPDPTLDLIEGVEDFWISSRTATYPDLAVRMQLMESIPAYDPYVLHQFWTFVGVYIDRPKEVVVDYWKHLLTIQ